MSNFESEITPVWKNTEGYDLLGRPIIRSILTKSDVDEMIKAGEDPNEFNFHQVHENGSDIDIRSVETHDPSLVRELMDFLIEKGLKVPDLPLFDPAKEHHDHFHISLDGGNNG